MGFAAPTEDPVVVDGAWYRLTIAPGARVVRLDDLSGRPWADLRLLASIDTLDGPDETLGVTGPTVVRDVDTRSTRLTWTLASSRWASKRLILLATEGTIEVTVEVQGQGRVTDASILSGRSVVPGATGTVMSRAWFETLFSPSPSDPARVVQRATDPAVIGVVSGSEAGRGDWFFTPGPFCFAVNRAAADDPMTAPDGPWLGFGLVAAPGAAGFTGFTYRAVDRGFGFGLAYDGKLEIDGDWRSPALVLAPADDPYDAIDQHRQDLERRGVVVPASTTGSRRLTSSPAWWREPMFCGWGAQCGLARVDGLPMSAAPRYATEASYDAFLGVLATNGVVPGTVVIDDKWHRAYGTCEPDTAKWPDLRGWIAARHDAGQRVLLWYKAWDAEGVAAEACITNHAGSVLGLDPSNPAGEAAIRAAVARMLSPDGLDADGLKIDFTARTPSGVATRSHGGEWGVDLLRRLLDTMADEARGIQARCAARRADTQLDHRPGRRHDPAERRPSPRRSAGTRRPGGPDAVSRRGRKGSVSRASDRHGRLVRAGSRLVARIHRRQGGHRCPGPLLRNRSGPHRRGIRRERLRAASSDVGRVPPPRRPSTPAGALSRSFSPEAGYDTDVPADLHPTPDSRADVASDEPVRAVRSSRERDTRRPPTTSCSASTSVERSSPQASWPATAVCCPS